MLTIVQRGGATHEKPPEVVRGMASRLPWAWDGLCFAVPFNDSTRDATRDLVNNAAPSGYAGSWTRDNRGNTAARLNSSGQYFEYPFNPAHNRPSTAITVYVRYLKVGTGLSDGGLFAKSHTTATYPYTSWDLQLADVASTGHVGFWVYTDAAAGASGYAETASYVLPTTEYVSIVGRWRKGDTVHLDVFDDRGTLKESADGSASPMGSGNIAYTTEPIRINALDQTVSNADGSYSQCMLWSRYLTDTELQALFADPYGWYSPRRETIGLSSPYPLVSGQGVMREVSSG